MQLMTVGCSPYFVATSTPSSTCVPSCSCVSTLPMSCSSAPRFASWTSSLNSAAMIPASQATSFECSRRFCPYRSEEHKSELQSTLELVWRLVLEEINQPLTRDTPPRHQDTSVHTR